MDEKRARLVARAEDLRAELDEAEWALREHDRTHPPPPCDGPYCVDLRAWEWMEHLEPTETPVLTRMRGRPR